MNRDKVYWKKRLEEAQQRQTVNHAKWRLVARFLAPIFDDLYSTAITTGELDRYDSPIYDSTGVKQLNVFANALHSSLASPSAPFFQYTLKSKDLQRDKRLSRWVMQTDETIQSILRGSNFHMEFSKAAYSMAAMGNMSTFQETDEPNGKRYGQPIFETLMHHTTYPIEDRYKEINTILRTVQMTAEQIANHREFREGFGRSEFLRDKAEREADCKLEILHVVTPKQDGEQTLMKRDEFISLYYVMENGVELPLNTVNGIPRGYTEKPFSYANWQVRSDQIYGRSPAMDVLGDVSSMQALTKLRLKAGYLATFPPFTQIPNLMDGSQLQLLPGATMKVKNHGALQPLPLQNRIDVAMMETENLKKNVKDGLYDSEYRFPDDLPQMTAVEARLRHLMSQGLFGPFVVRSDWMYFKPQIIRLFWVVYRSGAIAPPPIPIPESEIDSELISPLAMSQRYNEVIQAQEFVQQMYNLAAVEPIYKYIIDPHEYAAYVAERMNSTFYRFMKPREQIEAQIQQDQMMQSIPDLADAAQKAGQTKLALARANSGQ